MSSLEISVWFETESSCLVWKIQSGMQKSKSDLSAFYKNSNSAIILLVVYVDDIVITRRDSKGILSL